jgi:hypothetical protein
LLLATIIKITAGMESYHRTTKMPEVATLNRAGVAIFLLRTGF